MNFRFILLASLGFVAVAGVAIAAGVSPIVASEFIYDHGSYPQCHASTIVETSQGTLVAAWFGGTHEKHPDVCIYVARQVGGSWTSGAMAADGVQPDGRRFPTWNPVLFQAKGGPLFLFYKVGPSPDTWWGMEKISTDDGRTWSEARRLPDGILGPIKNKPVQLADGTIVSGSSTESVEQGWRVHLERSQDLGRSWQKIGPLEEDGKLNAIQPSLLMHGADRLQLLCRTKEGVIATSWSQDAGHHWTSLAPTELPNPNSGIDAVTLADGRQLLVYNASHVGVGGHSGPRYPLNLAISNDGRRWRSVLTLESEPMPDGYAYPAVIQSRDGLVHITYTWNRRKIKHVVLDPAKLPGGG